MRIVEVKDNKSIEAFRQLPFSIYANDSNWIPHLRQGVEAVFDAKQNSLLKKGRAKRWILYKDQTVVGRIAAFINPRTFNTFDQPTGGVGFFECVQNEQAAFKLFDHAVNWLKSEGMEAMDGPINFGEKERFWGLITKNFDLAPYYGQNYNPPYYVDFFENYGFKKYYGMYIYFRNAHDPLGEKSLNRATALEQDGNYSIQNWSKAKLMNYLEDFRTVYNQAWVGHDGRHELKSVQLKAFAKTIKPIIDERLSWFVYYNGEPVAFYIALPEINEWLSKVGDNLNWWGKAKFLYHKSTHKTKYSFGVVFGVSPEHQAKGIEALIFKKLSEGTKRRDGHDGVIITWIGDFNPKMIRVVENNGARVIREMTTYRYLFDPNKAFERSPLIGARAS